MVGKLTEVCDSKQKTLQEKKLALEQLSKMTDHCIEFTQYALDHGSDMALLYSKKQVTEHLKRIKCKRADIPNPEIPVRIHLDLVKVPDLIKGKYKQYCRWFNAMNYTFFHSSCFHWIGLSSGKYWVFHKSNYINMYMSSSKAAIFMLVFKVILLLSLPSFIVHCVLTLFSLPKHD